MTLPFHRSFEKCFTINKIVEMPPMTRHCHDCYELFFILEGNGKFYIDCNYYDIEKNSLFFVAPGRVHGWEYTQNINAYLIKFDLSLFQKQRLFDHLSIFHFDTIHLLEHEKRTIESLFEELYNEYSYMQSLKEMAICNLINLLLIYLQRMLPACSSESSMNTIVSQLDTLMYQNHYQLTPVTYYAKLLKMPVKKLNSYVKQSTGLNSNDYIRSKTLLEAQRLLRYDELTCNEIADRLGFIDPGYFSRFFKRETGLTPKLFRS